MIFPCASFAGSENSSRNGVHAVGISGDSRRRRQARRARVDRNAKLSGGGRLGQNQPVGAGHKAQEVRRRWNQRHTQQSKQRLCSAEPRVPKFEKGSKNWLFEKVRFKKNFRPISGKKLKANIGQKARPFTGHYITDCVNKNSRNFKSRLLFLFG